MRRSSSWLQSKHGRFRGKKPRNKIFQHPCSAVEPLEERRLLAVGTIFAVNAGGPEVIAPDATVWDADTSTNPSPFSNQATSQSGTFGNGKVVDTSSIAANVPSSIFNTERFDTGGTPMEWDFPVAPGNYEVRLYFAEIYNGAQSVGARVFDVSIEGNLVLGSFDTFAEAGPDTAIMKSFLVASDSNLDIDFAPIAQNPAIKGIEILQVVENDTLGSSTASLDFSNVDLGESATQQVTLTHIGDVNDADITILSTTITGSATFADDFNDAVGVVLAPGESTTVSVVFTPTVEGAEAASLAVVHTGINTPLNIALQGTGTLAPIGTALVRINAGGPAVGNPEWSVDTVANPSPLSNVAASQSTTFTTGQAIDVTDPSIPIGTPPIVFASERYDLIGGEELQWDIPAAVGPYEVRLYFAETFSGNASVGARVFDVSIENQLVLDDYDVFADVGAFKGVMKSFFVTSDGNLDIDIDRVADNPAIKAIEVVSLLETNTLFVGIESLDFGPVFTGAPSLQSVIVSNAGFPGDPSITLSSTSITGSTTFTDTFDDVNGVVLAPGESTTIGVIFAPADLTGQVATLDILHSGSNNPLSINLSGSGTSVAPVGFGKSTLAGLSSIANPTSLQWGPDDRLYVAHQNGTINVYTVQRNAANDYVATLDDEITLVKDIPNHDDDGTPNPGITTRLVTGIFVAGTAANPIIYVASSDPRIGGGPSGADLNLDTNSGILSRLTWDGAQWNKVDLVRGLPRSEENHASNGIALDSNTNTIYLAVAGLTNAGAPSNNFGLLTEYAYSAAILTIDLGAIDQLPDLIDVNGQVYKYDLPTLDDEDRDFDGLGGDADLANNIQDVFGGNDGKNQAILVPNGPVQIYAPGFRNAYDVVLTQNGNLYAIDNGSNAGWGDIPILDPQTGLATNAVSEPGVTNLDNLQFISGPGYYGGHPNPTRANTDNTFNSTNPQSPVALVGGNPIENFFSTPQTAPGALAVFGSSTNGIAEYTASNFGGALQGDLLAASFFGGNSISRLSPDATGAALDLNEVLFSNVGVAPLDVTAIGDNGLFPGSIWVADWFLDTIVVFEANDFESGGGGPIDPNDLDGDGYSNADEIANDTNPNSAADFPADYDGDFLSNLLDDNDDNDSLLDVDDPFAIDADNGNTTFVGISYTWENNVPSPGGLLNLGFTGLMINGVDNYEDLFDTSTLTAGGAAGVLTLDEATEGDATGSTNTQEQAFQFGVNVSGETSPFTARTRLLAPFSGVALTGNQSMGLFIGTGDQDNYIKIVVTANGGSGGISSLSEVGGVVSVGALDSVALPGPSSIDLYLLVDPVALTVQPSYEVTQGGVTGPRTDLGSPLSVPSAWLNGPTALAVGIISTSEGIAPEFAATWDFVTVLTSNSTPTVVSPIGSIVAVENDPDTLIDLTTVFNDTEDGTNLTFSVESNDNPTLVNASIVSGTLTLDYLADQFGTASIVVRATDSGGLFVEDTISVTVNPLIVTPPVLENGFVASVSSAAWTTVNLANTYTSMIVVATPNYDAQSPPLVTRIQNATGSSFDVMVQRADGSAAVTTADVYFFVVEEGVYTVAENGIQLEAVKYNSTVTDGAGNWNGEQQAYNNTYISPVVLGQVMTYNDAAFSTFWSKGSTVQSAPSATELSTGKHVGEDPTGRADETIGYVVFEAGNYSLGNVEFTVGLGPNTVQNVTNFPAAVYTINGPTNPTAAILSQSGMDGGNGGWALLSGSNPFSSTTLNLSVDEDQILDAERYHIAEEVAYVVFGDISSVAGGVKTPGIYNAQAATFLLRSEQTAGLPDVAIFNYGLPDWTPIVGDWNGDGVDTVGLYNPETATYFLNNALGGVGNVPAFNFGIPGWVPIIGDWNGDGIDTIGVVNPQTATFFLRNSNDVGTADITFNYGMPGWVPIAGDWNGDGIDTIGEFNPLTASFFLRNSNTTGTGDIEFSYGGTGWIPLAGDWDGDNVDTIGVWDPQSAGFYLRNTNTAGSPDVNPFVYGAPGQTPILGNWASNPVSTALASVQEVSPVQEISTAVPFASTLTSVTSKNPTEAASTLSAERFFSAVGASVGSLFDNDAPTDQGLFIGPVAMEAYDKEIDNDEVVALTSNLSRLGNPLQRATDTALQRLFE